MTWLLTASGNSPAAGDQHKWREVEQKLFDELRAVLSKPEYAASSSWFRGIHLAASDMHKATAATPADAPGPAVPAKAPRRAGKTQG